jgi:hypothetical protein
MEDAFLLNLRWSDRPAVFFGEAVKERRVKSYGLRASTADVRPTGDGTKLEVRFGLPDTYQTDYGAPP